MFLSYRFARGWCKEISVLHDAYESSHDAHAGRGIHPV